MTCDKCFIDYLVDCQDEIRVYAQLQPLHDYTWIITDKFDNQYSGVFSTDTDGFWIIPVYDLPEGLLTQYSGEFTLQVQGDGCKPVNFKIAQEYDCVRFTIKGGTRVKEILGCDFSCTPAAGSQTELIPFTDQTEVTVNWTTEYGDVFGNSPTVQVFHLIYGSTYQLAIVQVQQTFEDGVLQSITIDNGGVATGYVLIS